MSISRASLAGKIVKRKELQEVAKSVQNQSICQLSMLPSSKDLTKPSGKQLNQVIELQVDPTQALKKAQKGTVPMAKRVEVLLEKENLKQERLERERLDKELREVQECSFRPNTAKTSTYDNRQRQRGEVSNDFIRGYAQKPVYQRLYNQNQALQRQKTYYKMAELDAKRKEKEEMAECTFQPKVNRSYKASPLRPRP